VPGLCCWVCPTGWACPHSSRHATGGCTAPQTACLLLPSPIHSQQYLCPLIPFKTRHGFSFAWALAGSVSFWRGARLCIFCRPLAHLPTWRQPPGILSFLVRYADNVTSCYWDGRTRDGARDFCRAEPPLGVPGGWRAPSSRLGHLPAAPVPHFPTPLWRCLSPVWFGLFSLSPSLLLKPPILAVLGIHHSSLAGPAISTHTMPSHVYSPLWEEVLHVRAFSSPPSCAMHRRTRSAGRGSLASTAEAPGD